MADPPSPLNDEFFSLLLSTTDIDSQSSSIHSFLTSHTAHSFDHPHLLSLTLSHLASLTPSHVLLLHTAHLVPLPSLLQHLPPSSPASSHLCSLLLSAHRLHPASTLNVSFASSPLTSLLLLLLHLSSLPSDAFPLYPACRTAAEAVLERLFFTASAEEEAQAMRQRLLVLMLLTRPVEKRKALLGHWLLRCLRPAGGPEMGFEEEANAGGVTVTVSAPHLSAVFFFLLTHLGSAAVVTLYAESFGALDENGRSGQSVWPIAHRALVALLLGPARYQRGVAIRLFALYSSLIIDAAQHRVVGTAVHALRLGRHAVQLLPVQIGGSSLYPLLPGSEPALPRDYSEWIDGVMTRLLKPEGDADSTDASPTKANKKRRANRRERFVPKKPAFTSPTAEEKPRSAASTAGVETISVDVAVLADVDMDPAWLAGEGFAASRLRPLSSDDEVDTPKKRARKPRSAAKAARSPSETDVRGQAAEAQRRREARRGVLAFVLSVLRATMDEDDAEVLVHHVRMVKGWRGGDTEEDAGLLESEVDSFVSAAKRQINRLATGAGNDTHESADSSSHHIILLSP